MYSAIGVGKNSITSTLIGDINLNAVNYKLLPYRKDCTNSPILSRKIITYLNQKGIIE
jgi:hypothetical protein